MRATIAPLLLLLFLLVPGWIIAAAEDPPQKRVQPVTQEVARPASDSAPNPDADALAAMADYRLGANDLVGITVYDFPDLTRDVRVSEDGNITLPLVPKPIHAGGLTRHELEKSVADALQTNGIVNSPQVTVFIKEYRAKTVTVLGAVRSPLVYNLMGPTTLLEVLSRAGGLNDEAADELTVTTNGLARRFSCRDVLEGEPAANISLQGGETVHVPRAGIIYVVGAVRRPGGYTMRSEQPLSVVKAIALAEDLKPSAARDKAVIVRSKRSGEKTEIAIDLKKILSRKAEDPVLQANDVLFVPDSGGRKALFRGMESAIGVGTQLIIYRGW